MVNVCIKARKLGLGHSLVPYGLSCWEVHTQVPVHSEVHASSSFQEQCNVSGHAATLIEGVCRKCLQEKSASYECFHAHNDIVTVALFAPKTARRVHRIPSRGSNAPAKVHTSPLHCPVSQSVSQ